MSIHRILVLFLVAGCVAPEGSEAPPSSLQQTSAELASSLAPLSLVTRGRARRDDGTELEKATLEYQGIPVLGVGVRIVHAGDSAIVLGGLRLGPEASLVATQPTVAAARALELAQAAVDWPNRAARAPSLAFEAMVAGEGDEQVVSQLRLTWRVELFEQPENHFPSQIAVLDAHTGQRLRLDPAALHATVQGLGYFRRPVDLQAELVGGTSLCLSDLTRTTSVNGDPCGAIGPGIQTFVNTYSFPPALKRVMDVDGVFGDGVLPTSLGDASGEHGRTVAADAQSAIANAYDFFRDGFGRQRLAVTDSLQVVVNSLDRDASGNLLYASDAAWIPARNAIVVGPAKFGVNNKPAADPEWLGHEYAHAIIAQAVGSPNARSEFQVLHEGIADCFGILTDAWAYRPPGGLFEVPAPNGWIFGDHIYSTDLRYFEHPSDQTNAVDAYDPNPLTGTASLISGGADPHRIAGIMRRQFYFLSQGAAAAPAGSPVPRGGSMYLPQGMVGITLTPATQILYKTITEGLAPNGQPTFLTMRNAMVGQTAHDYGVCSDFHKATLASWAAVNVGSPPDWTAPTVALDVRQNGRNAQITVDVTTAIGDPTPSVELTVDSVSFGTFPLVFKGPNGPSWGFGSTFYLAGEAVGWGKHTYLAKVTDSWCVTGTRKKSFQLDLDGPGLTFTKTGPPKQPHLEANVSDVSGIQKVEFYNGPSLFTATTAPYVASYDTSGWPDGFYPIRVRAYDTWGNVTELPYSIEADNTAPVPSLAVGTAGPPFMLTATASDANSIQHTEVKLDGVTVASGGSSASYAYSPSDDNNHQLSETAIDAFGNIGVSAPVSAPHDRMRPALTLTARQWGFEVNLSATASDTCGVASMMMVADGVELASVSGASWSGTLPSGLFQPGWHLFSVEALDNCGNLQHADQSFLVAVNPPTLTISVDASDKKRPVLTLRVIHDRPIRLVEVWRGQTFLFSQNVATQTLNPIIDVTVDTSDPSWPNGDVDLQVTVFDQLNIPGQTHTQVRVDNEAPNPRLTFRATGRLIELFADPSDAYSPITKVWMDVYAFGVPRTYLAPPYSYAATIPTGISSTDVWVAASAWDTFGNVGDWGSVLHMTCEWINSSEVCSWTYNGSPF